MLACDGTRRGHGEMQQTISSGSDTSCILSDVKDTERSLAFNGHSSYRIQPVKNYDLSQFGQSDN
jgi:hypothetical protein